MGACGTLLDGSIRSTIGIANAAVLPVPVWACASRSLPSRSTGIASCCTGAGAMKPRSSLARATSGWISSAPKRAVIASVTLRSLSHQVSRVYARLVPGSFRIARLFGIDVRVHLSWVLIFLYLSYGLANQEFADVFPTSQTRALVAGA